ncbi:cytochrome c class I [Nitrosococcus halophilus Nc 4]|uniref:Cytochrome c class I n=1 Tax=Nitrosococcus halophilus (strain Nc4) TaxID=472759 RepID=D5C0J6_NITHN|nr:c-type cytochrome [Nitrosococcus halophilus]ADE16319.1 cytochrome c class I [Nitrosococcus halophilus Nc 4]
MSKLIHSINPFFSQRLLSIASIGIVTFSMLVAGCTEQNTETEEAMSPEAIATRIEPVGKVNIIRMPEEASEATDAPASSREEASETPDPDKEDSSPITDTDEVPPPAGGKDTQLIHGKRVVENSCAACHTGKVPGAPVIGNAEDWRPRLVQGEEVLVQHAIQGYKAMPPKGGNFNLSDEDIAAAVAYLISQVRQ